MSQEVTAYPPKRPPQCNCLVGKAKTVWNITTGRWECICEDETKKSDGSIHTRTRKRPNRLPVPTINPDAQIAESAIQNPVETVKGFVEENKTLVVVAVVGIVGYFVFKGDK